LKKNIIIIQVVISKIRTWLFFNQRLKMLNSIRIILTDTPVLTITTDILLFGSEHLSTTTTTKTFINSNHLQSNDTCVYRVQHINTRI